MSVRASALCVIGPVVFQVILLAIVWTVPTNAATARLLIYSATQQFRHDSIPTAIDVLKKKGPSIDVVFDATEDASMFEDANLAKYDALLFLSTTGKGVDPH